jgi:hypothetical protein
MIKDRNIAFDAAINPMKLLGAGFEPLFGDTYYVLRSTRTAAYNWLQARVPSNRLFNTIAKADSAMVDNTNARCLIMPGHTESLAAELALTTVGAEFIGLGRGPLRPTLTQTAAANIVSLDGNYQTLANIAFAAPGIDNVPADIDVVGAGCQILGTWHEGSATSKNKVDLITLTATADDTLIRGMRAFNTVVALTGGGINLEGACSRIEIDDVHILSTLGYDLGAIYDGATALNLFIHDSTFSNAKADTVVCEFGNNSTGLMRDCFVNGRNTTIANSVAAGTGMTFFNVLAVEEVAKNAIPIPVVDAD